MKACARTTKQRAKGFSKPCPENINIQGPGSMIKSTGTEKNFLKTSMNIREPLKMENIKETEFLSFLTDLVH